MREFEKLALAACALLAACAGTLATGLLQLRILESSVHLCLFRALTGVPCPGCGMVHALLHGFQGHWAQSFRAHVLGLPLLLLWTAWAAWGTVNSAAGRSFSEGFPLSLAGARGVAALAVVLGAYCIRLAGIC